MNDMSEVFMATDSAASSATARRRVLLVEDDRLSRAVIEAMLDRQGYAVESAENGAEAYALMREDPTRADVVLSDRLMPVMDGLSLVRKLKREAATAGTPIVMLTGSSESTAASEGIEAGAYYYLTKPVDETLLTRVIDAALAEVDRRRRTRDELQNHQCAFANLQVMRFTLRRPDEVGPVASLLVSIAPEPDKILQGVFDLVQNGVEHGILRLGLEEKQRLLATGGLESTLRARAADPAYTGEVEATAARKDGGLVFVVKDNGPGFVWRPYLRADPARAMALCGRGISRAAMLFDRVSYNEQGSSVLAFLGPKQSAAW